MPLAFKGMVITATKGNFNFEKSLNTGALVFTSNSIEKEGNEEGFTYGRVHLFSNSVLIMNTWEGDYALAHELIHVYQNDGLFGFNSFLNKPLMKLQDRNTFGKKYSKLFYYDLHRVMIYGLYYFETQKDGYGGNLFEQGAFYFSRKRI